MASVSDLFCFANLAQVLDLSEAFQNVQLVLLPAELSRRTAVVTNSDPLSLLSARRATEIASASPNVSCRPTFEPSSRKRTLQVFRKLQSLGLYRQW
jgi:hypothetical protein